MFLYDSSAWTHVNKLEACNSHKWEEKGTEPELRQTCVHSLQHLSRGNDGAHGMTIHVTLQYCIMCDLQVGHLFIRRVDQYMAFNHTSMWFHQVATVFLSDADGQEDRCEGSLALCEQE